MNPRTKRAKQMMATEGYATQFNQDSFRVRSQTDTSKFYIVSRTGNGLKCECKDHEIRKSDCKHIKIVLEIMKQNKCYRNNTFRITERSLIKVCKFCDSGNIMKKGFKNNKSGKLQIYKCKDCKKRFTTNFGFEKKQFDQRTITQSIQMYYQGMSVRDIADNLEMIGIDVSHKTVYNWVAEYSDKVSKYLNDIVPRTNDRPMVRADEV